MTLKEENLKWKQRVKHKWLKEQQILFTKVHMAMEMLQLYPKREVLFFTSILKIFSHPLSQKVLKSA